MKAIFLVLIASLFASEFTDIEEYDAKVQWSVGITFGNMDMSAPEFDAIDDEFKIKIKDIIKTVLPVVVPHIPTIGPIIAPFLSEEDMEPEMIDYDKDELAELVLAVLAEDYEMDAGFWSSVKKLVKKAAPIVIKKLVPMIPKVGPIIAPFLGEEDSDEMIMNMTNPFAKKVHWRPHRKPINGTKPRPRPHPRPHYRMRPHPKKFKKIVKRTPEPTVEPELDEIKLGSIIKKILPVVVPMIPKVGPIIAPFLSEEDSDEMEVPVEMEELILGAVANQLIEEGYELDEGFWSKVKSWIKPRIPQIIRTLVPMIPKVGPKIAPIIEPFLGDEDSFPSLTYLKRPATVAPITDLKCTRMFPTKCYTHYKCTRGYKLSYDANTKENICVRTDL